MSSGVSTVASEELIAAVRDAQKLPVCGYCKRMKPAKNGATIRLCKRCKRHVLPQLAQPKRLYRLMGKTKPKKESSQADQDQDDPTPYVPLNVPGRRAMVRQLRGEFTRVRRPKSRRSV